MKKRVVIDERYLPAKLPLTFTMALYLMLDKFHAVGWVWGVVGTLVAILWTAAFAVVFTQEKKAPSEIR